jgi:eukaryotic-like serine/threonine-protein kinase
MATRPPLDDTPTRDIGPYRLAHRIAVGGMAEVYRALSPQAAGGDRAVVIKRLLPSLLNDPEQRAMFDHEAELGRRIDHPNVVGVLDHGIDGDAPYLVLEYVFGVDLWRLMRWMKRTGRTMPIPTALWIGGELLAGLAAVHSVTDDAGAPLHIVHRDVSPSNLFLSVHGDVKLGDLGIARAALFESQRRHGAGFRAKGKLGYLPPEQVAGRSVDQRGDVFSAAVVIAELLMGRPLFAGGTEIGVLLAIRDGDLSPFRAILPSLPPGLGAPLLSALEKEPEARTRSVLTLKDALRPHMNTPIDELRSVLGALVVRAMDDEGVTTDRTSLAETIEKDALSVDAITPSEPADSDRPAAGPRYHVEREGKRIGPYTQASLVRAITTGEVSATDQVRIDGSTARMIAQVAALARHLPASTRTPNARRRTQMAETSELYDLGGRPILAVLMDVLHAKDDGLLLCERSDGLRKEIYLELGIPIFVTSNQPQELLGEMLVKNGVIDRAELDMALALMPRFEGRLGETLVALGLVDPVLLVRQISEQVKEKLLDLFLWTQGHAALYRDVERPERAFPLHIDPWDIFVAGAARRIAANLENACFAGRERDVLEQTDRSVERFGLPDRLAGVWTACQAPRSLREIEGLCASPSEGRAVVLVLLELGVLRWRAMGKRA